MILFFVLFVVVIILKCRFSDEKLSFSLFLECVVVIIWIEVSKFVKYIVWDKWRGMLKVNKIGIFFLIDVFLIVVYLSK